MDKTERLLNLKNSVSEDVLEKTEHPCKMTKRGQEILEHLESTQRHDLESYLRAVKSKF